LPASRSLLAAELWQLPKPVKAIRNTVYYTVEFTRELTLLLL